MEKSAGGNAFVSASLTLPVPAGDQGGVRGGRGDARSRLRGKELEQTEYVGYENTFQGFYTHTSMYGTRTAAPGSCSSSFLHTVPVLRVAPIEMPPVLYSSQAGNAAVHQPHLDRHHAPPTQRAFLPFALYLYPEKIPHISPEQEQGPSARAIGHAGPIIRMLLCTLPLKQCNKLQSSLACQVRLEPTRHPCMK